MSTQKSLQELLYFDKHLSCHLYAKDLNLGFKYEKIEAGTVFLGENNDVNIMFFCIAGKCEIFYENKVFIVTKGQMILIPVGSTVGVKVIETIDIVLMIFEDILNACDRTLLTELCKDIHQSAEYQIQIYEMHHPIDTFAGTLAYCLRHGINCTMYHELKHKELFFYLRLCYSKKELGDMFHQVIGKHYSFRIMILREWTREKSLNDMIDLANMSKTTFLRTFHSVFGMTPLQWQHKMLVQLIIRLSVNPETSIQDLMEKTMILSPSQLNRFCQKKFKCTPKQVLEKYRNLSMINNTTHPSICSVFLDKKQKHPTENFTVKNCNNAH